MTSWAFGPVYMQKEKQIYIIIGLINLFHYFFRIENYLLTVILKKNI